MYWAWEVLDLLSVTLLASSDVTCRHSESIHARAREREWVRFLSLQLLRHSLRKVFRLRGSVKNWRAAFRRQQTRHTWEEDDDVTTQTQTQSRDARKTSGSYGWVTSRSGYTWYICHSDVMCCSDGTGVRWNRAHFGRRETERDDCRWRRQPPVRHQPTPLQKYPRGRRVYHYFTIFTYDL